MSTTVDQRVVSMQFDNADFEKGVQQTLNSLNTLNKNIEKNAVNNVDSFKGLNNSLNDVENSIRKGIIPSMDTIQNKFSVMGTMMDQTIRNITNRMVNVSANIAKMFTISPVTDGLHEYETQIGAIQTIMANTGLKGQEGMAKITAALDKLNEYADMTIYNFTEMTKNIGTFTAAGLDLDVSTQAIKGIANLAAVSGSTSEQASRAMYQLSQALASGTVNLQDWNSVVNAGMGGKVFQDALLRTAKAMHSITDEQYELIKSGKETFRNSIGSKNGTSWLNTKVLSETLKEFGGDMSDAELKAIGYTKEEIREIQEMADTATKAATQVKTFTQLVDTVKEALGSGWTKSFEIMFGNFNEAQAMWTGISNVLQNMIDKMSDARNNMLQMWKDAGGRVAVLQTFVNIVNGIYSVIKPIKDAIGDVFGKLDGAKLAGINKAIAEITSGLQLSNEQMTNIYNVVYILATALKNVLNILWQYKTPLLTIWAFVTAFSTLRGLLTGGLGFGSILSILKMITALGIGVKLLNIKNLLNKITPTINTIAKSVYSLFGNISQHINNILSTIHSSKLDVFIQSISDGISAFTNELSKISTFRFDGIQSVFKAILGLVNGIIVGITSGINSFNKFSKALNPFNNIVKSASTTNKTLQKTSGMFTMVAYAAEKAQMPFYDVAAKTVRMADSVEKLGDSSEQATSQFGGFLGTIKGYLSGVASSFPILQNLAKLINSIGIEKLIVIGTLFLYMKAIKKLAGAINTLNDSLNPLVSITGALSSISGYFKSLTKGNKYKAYRDIAIGIGLITASLAAFAVALNFIDSNNFKIAFAALAGISVIIVGVIKSLSHLSQEVNPAGIAALGVGFVAFGVILAEFTVLLIGVGTAIAFLTNTLGSVDDALNAIGYAIIGFAMIFGTVLASVFLFAKELELIGNMTPMILKGCVAILAMSGALITLAAGGVALSLAIVSIGNAIRLLIGYIANIIKYINEFIISLDTALTDHFGDTIEKIISTMGAIAILVVGVLAVMQVLKTITDIFSDTSIKISVSVIGVAASVYILSKAMNKFAACIGEVESWKELAIKLAAPIGLLVVTFGSLVGTLFLIKKFKLETIAEEFKTVSNAFVKVSSSLLILAHAVNILAAMNLPILAKGIISVGIMLAGLVAALKVLDKVSVGKIAVGILGLVTALYLLVPLFALFGSTFSIIAPGMLIVSAALLALGGSIRLIGSMDLANVVANTAIMILAVGSLAYICASFAKMDTEDIWVSIRQLAAVFAILLGTTFIMAKISEKILTMRNGVNALVAVAGVLSVAVGVLSVAVGVLATLPWQNVLAAAGGLSMAMLAFAGAAAILGAVTLYMKADNILPLCGLLVTFAATLGVLAFAIYQLQDTPFSVFGGFAMVLGVLAVAIAGIIAIIGVFSAQLDVASVFMVSFAGVLLSFAAAALSFGLAGALISAGVSLIVVAVSGLLTVLTKFIPTLQEFIQFISNISSNAKDIAAMSASLIVLGRALTVLAVGMGASSIAGIAFATALYLVGKACGVFAKCLTLAGIAAVSFAQNVKVALGVIGELAGDAVEWGSHIAGGIANGLAGGIKTVGNAALSVAKTIWGYLHQSDAEWGPLKGVWQWGAHLVQNIGGGMLKEQGWLSGVASSVGSAEKSGFESGASGTGSSTISNIVSELFGGIDNISAAGASGGAAYMKAFLNQIKGVGGYNKEAVARGQAKRKGQFKDLTFDRDEAPISGYHGKQTSKGILNLSDLLPDLSSKEADTTKSTDDLTNSLGDLGGAADSAGKSTGGAGSSASDAAEAEKEAAEAAKTHAKYLQYLDGTATQYMHTSGVLNKTVDNTSVWEKSKSAIADLAKEMYEASLTGDETADELAKKQQKIEEAFVKSYETIRDKIKDSLDLMKAFDLQTSSITKSSTILKNMQSQFLGNAELASRQQLLAQMGLDVDYLQELIEKGSEGLPEINSLLRMSRTEIQQFNRGLADRKGWSEFIAQNGLAAIASAKHNQQLRATVKTQDEQIVKAKDINTTYIDISQKAMSATGVVANVMNGALNGLANEFTQIANEMGVTTDQLTSYVNGTALTVEQASLKQIDNYNEVKKAFIEYSDTVGTESDRIKSALSSLSTSFDELKLLSDDDETFSITDMQDNIESQIDGINTWSSEITDLAGRIGNTDLLQQLADMGTSGYKYVHALYEASDEELDEFVASFEEKMQTIESVSQTYGNQMGLNVVEGINSSLTTYFQQLQNGGDQSFGELASLINKHLEAIGQQGGTGLSSGIQSTQDTVIGSAKILANDLETSVAAVVNQDTGYKKTSDYMLGMLQGLREYKDDVMREIDEITSAMEDHTADGLDVHSPSRFTKWVGKNLILGFIKGFSENEDSLMTSMDSIVNNMRDAIGTAYNILTTDGDMNPTITPILDLSDIQNRSKSIGSMFNSKSFQLDANLGTIHTASENTSRLNDMLQGMNAQNNKGGNSYNFVQNNYSPKALSRLEIYRQTKNQFAQMKGVVNSNG